MSNIRDQIKDMSEIGSSATDMDWMNYVIDHRDLIIQNSVQTPVDPQMMSQYRFRPHAFLDHLRVPRHFHWIVKFINHINHSIQFVGHRDILIPNTGYIQKLYEQYVTIKS